LVVGEEAVRAPRVHLRGTCGHERTLAAGDDAHESQWKMSDDYQKNISWHFKCFWMVAKEWSTLATKINLLPPPPF
jgi:hypothetical protein